MSIAIICGIITMFGYGVANLFGTYSSRKNTPLVASIWVYAFCTILTYALLPTQNFPIARISLLVWGLSALLALFMATATFLQNYAMTHGNASVHTAIVGANSAVVVLLVVSVLGERLSPGAWIALSVTFIGVLFCSIDPAEVRRAHISLGTLAAIISALLFGVANMMQKFLIDQTNWLIPSAISLVVGLALLVVVARLRRVPMVPRLGKTNLAWYGAIVAVAGAVEYYGYGVGPASIIAILLSANTVVFAVIARYKLKDRITRLQQAGIVVTFAGIALLGAIGR